MGMKIELVGGPLCGKELEVTADTQRVRIPDNRLYIEHTYKGATHVGHGVRIYQRRKLTEKFDYVGHEGNYIATA
jgi:hypothetical protein